MRLASVTVGSDGPLAAGTYERPARVDAHGDDLDLGVGHESVEACRAGHGSASANSSQKSSSMRSSGHSISSS